MNGIVSIKILDELPLRVFTLKKYTNYSYLKEIVSHSHFL